MAERVSGYPTSSNRASSMHLHWLPRAELSSVAVTITVPVLPPVPDLYFWALQVSFAGPDGITGAAHLGLQWHTGYPGGTAVNWGGYHSNGSILDGTESPLPSPLGNPHTKAFPWAAGLGYRLTVGADEERGPGWWTGEVWADEELTRVRSLHGGGDRLVAAMTWTEAFCRCEAEPASVIWSRPSGVDLVGGLYRPERITTTYQSEADGGCSNTDIRGLPQGIAQITGVVRTNPAGTIIPF